MLEGSEYTFDRLLELAHEKSDYSQTEIIQFTAEILMGAAAPHPQQEGQTEPKNRERDLACEILLKLLKEAQTSLKAMVAKKFAQNMNVPKALISFLAEDSSFEVAQPILIQSGLLEDRDLLKIIETQNRLRALAIATRAELGDRVSMALVELKDESVSLTLAQNRKSEFGVSVLEALATQAMDFESLQKPLTLRSEMPATLAATLYWWVGQDLRADILERFDISPALLDDTLQVAMQKLVDHHNDPRTLTKTQENYADQLYQSGSLKPELLIYVLRQGQVALFMHFFAKLSGFPVSAVQAILTQDGVEAFTIICRSLKVMKPEFATLFLLSRAARAGDHTVDPTELGKVMSLFDRIGEEQAHKICNGWHKDLDNLYRLIQRKNWEA